MDENKISTAAGLLFFTMAFIVLRRKRGSCGSVRRWWVHPINQLRDDHGAWPLLMDRFRIEFPDKHRRTMRVSRESFDKILRYVKPTIAKQDTHLRQSIPAEQRLCITLFYLATGDSFHTLHLFFRKGESTIRHFVYETCQAIWDTMSAEFVKTPTTSQEWKKIAREYENYWNFPHCVGSIDGKHCTIQAPKNSGSEFFNYKKYFSIVLMAVSDAMYRFVYVDVGTAGRWSDGGTFDNCSLNRKLTEGRLNLPADTQLPGELANGL